MLDIIRDTIESIKPVSPLRLQSVQAHLCLLTKTPGSLEELTKKYSAIRDTDQPCINKKSVIVFAADHGVTQEGIST